MSWTPPCLRSPTSGKGGSLATDRWQGSSRPIALGRSFWPAKRGSRSLADPCTCMHWVSRATAPGTGGAPLGSGN
eukprot:1855673-Pyramimonas_sp.AAC.1